MSGTEIRYSEAFKQKVVGEVASGRFRSPYEAARAIELSNHRRPHTSLGYRKPAQVHALAA